MGKAVGDGPSRELSTDGNDMRSETRRPPPTGVRTSSRVA